MDENIKIALSVLMVIIVVVCVVVWSEKQDDIREVVILEYEYCVMKRFGTSPAFYNIENGEYPECEKDNIDMPVDVFIRFTPTAEKAETLEFDYTTSGSTIYKLD